MRCSRATRPASCRGAFVWLGGMKERYGDRLVVVALALESDEPEVRKLAAELKLPFRWGLRTPEILKQFGDVSAVPTMFVFDQAGKPVGAFYGSTPEEHRQAEARIAALLK